MKTDIKVFKCKDEDSKTKAFVSLTIDDAIAVNSIKIVEGKNGLFVSMPQRKDPSSTSGYKDVVFPITPEAREELYNNILAAHKAVAE